MLGTFVNVFKIPDLRNKILFTVALLCIYRIGFYISVPGFNQEAIAGAESHEGFRIRRSAGQPIIWKCSQAAH